MTRVPEEARAVVEGWLRGERTCRESLEVDVEAVDSGFIVNARDGRGRLRVRLVPDVHTLGVLIASWSADGRWTSPAGPRTAATAAHAAIAVIGDDQPRRGATARMLFGGIAGPEQGLRTQMDLLRGPLVLGVSMSGQIRNERPNFQTTVYGGFELGATWQLRGQLGAGLRVTEPVVSLGAGTANTVSAEGYDIATEALLLVGRQLGARWSVNGGLLINLTLQTYRAGRVEPRSPVPLAILGVSRAL